MPLYDPSQSIVRQLRTFDPLLRVRWSDCQRFWRLERKVTRGMVWPPSEIESPSQYEERIAARDGYILVDTIKKQHLTERLIDVLRRNDLWSRGGAAGVASEWDLADQERDMQRRQSLGDELEAAARERYRYMNTIRTVSESASATAPAGGMSIMSGV